MEGKEKVRESFFGSAKLNKRQYRRFLIDLQVKYWQSKNPNGNLCRVVDISKGGLQLYVAEKIAVGQNLKLRIFIVTSFESKSIETDVQVVWKGTSLKSGGYRIGVRFVDIFSSSPLLVLAKRVRNLEEWRDEYDNEIDPKLARVYLLLGKIYMFKNDHNNAILYFNKSIEVLPNQGEAYFYRGFTYYRKGVYEKSWEDILKAREFDFRIPQEFLENLDKAHGVGKEYLDHFNKGLGTGKEVHLPPYS